jgi:cell division septation protein DedD
VKDYRERKPVGKNRPKKRPVGLYVTVVLGTALPTFALGILAGWFLFRTDPAIIQKQVTEQVEKELAKAAPPPGSPTGAGVSAGPAPEPSLTFFETLPKGGRTAIGSGLNPASPQPHQPPAPPPADAAAVKPPPVPVKPAPATPAKPAPAATAVAAHAAVPATAPPAAGTPKGATAPTAPKKPALARGTFAVQTASYQDKREAEEVRNRLMAKGHTAYIVVTDVPGKGLWYRIRIGRHLDEAAAKELADKLGKSAMVVPE